MSTYIFFLDKYYVTSTSYGERRIMANKNNILKITRYNVIISRYLVYLQYIGISTVFIEICTYTTHKLLFNNYNFCIKRQCRQRTKKKERMKCVKNTNKIKNRLSTNILNTYIPIR